MFDTVFAGTASVVIGAILVVFLVQLAWGRWEERCVWDSLSKPRDLPDGFEEDEVVRVSAGTLTLPEGMPLTLPAGTKVTDVTGALVAVPGGATITPPPDTTMTFSCDVPVTTRNIKWGRPKKSRSLPPWAVRRGELQAFKWDWESEYWAGEAECIRRSYLCRTQATADKWRNVFAALLAVFGAVVLVKPALPAGQHLEGRLYVFIIFALVMAAQAVAYTGWAGAGLPHRLVNATAATAFVEQTNHAAHLVVRLRVGLFCGGASAVALVLAVATSLSSGMD